MLYTKTPFLPKHCDICMQPIGTYRPYYSMAVRSHFAVNRMLDHTLILCPDCFRAYGDFLEKEQTKQLHIREIRESMHPDDDIDTYPAHLNPIKFRLNRGGLIAKCHNKLNRLWSKLPFKRNKSSV